MSGRFLLVVFALSVAVAVAQDDPLASDPDSLLGIKTASAPAPHNSHGHSSSTAAHGHGSTAAHAHDSHAAHGHDSHDPHGHDSHDSHGAHGAHGGHGGHGAQVLHDFVDSHASVEVAPLDAAKTAAVAAVASAEAPTPHGPFVALRCYRNSVTSDRIYTTNVQELGPNGKDDWKTCGFAAMVSSEPVEGFDQLRRYLNLNTLKHVYSAQEITQSKTLRPEGFEGYVSTDARVGMVPLRSFLDKSTGEFMLSAETSFPSNFQEQGVIGYVKPVPADIANSNPSDSPVTTPTQTKFWADYPGDSRLQPVFRYWNPALQDHFYTMNYDVLGAGKNGWRYQGIQCYIYPTKIEGTVPLYRYWNLRMGDHFYTTDFYDMGEGKDGYKFKGILGYVRDSPAKDTVPLFRYFNKEIGDHFYTTNAMSTAQGHDEWTPEGVAAYVYPVPNPSQAEQANEYALLVPLYRYWNKRFADHFYTITWKEVDAGTHGWEYQGVQALVYPKQEPGTVPLYRYWNIRTLDHFYTTNFAALGQGGQDGWKYEGIECYVDVYRKPGTVPLYRYFNNKLNDHFYTTKWLSRQFKGWVYEGIQCYVHRKPLDSTDNGRVKAPDGMAPLYRYWSTSAKDHLYNTNWDELGAGSQGYVLEGVEGFLWRDSSAGGVPFHRYYNPRVKDHFYTTDYAILKSGGLDGWEYEGIIGYIASSSRPGLVKLRRYYSKNMKDHFYTTAFIGASKNSYKFQGVAGFVLPFKDSISAPNSRNTAVSPSKLMESTTDLHSYYNPKTHDHFYTTNYDVLGAGQSGWVYNGVVAKILSQQLPNTRKLRQYFSRSRQDHRYTVRHIHGGDWQYEGVVGYIFDSQVPGSKSLMNFENARVMDNALSLNEVGPVHGGPFEYKETLGYALSA